MQINIQEQNRKYYDHESAVYDDNRYGSIAGQRVDAFHKRVLDELLVRELERDSSVLEMGCGTGRLLAHLLKYDLRLSGADMSPGMLDVARRRLGGHADRIALHESLANELPFPDASLDAVYSILVINLIPDYSKAVREVGRVIKPGGIFVFNVPNLYSVYILGGMYVNLRGKTVGANDAGHRYSHWFSSSEWRTTLTKSGFSVEQVLGQPPWLRTYDGAGPIAGDGVWGLLAKSVYIKARKNNG